MAFAAIGAGAAVIGAGTSIHGAMQGARSGRDAQRNAARQNQLAEQAAYDQRLENQRFQLQQRDGVASQRSDARETLLMQMIAAQQSRDDDRSQTALQNELALASRTDSRGNTTQYIPGRGFVVTPSAMTKNITDATDAETLNRNTVDAMRNRTRRGENFTRQRTEGQMADAQLGSMELGARSLEDIQAANTELGVAEAVSGADDLRNRIGLNDLRTGGSGSEALLAMLGRNSLMDTRTAIARARASSPGQFIAEKGAREGGALSRYAMLANRANAEDGSQTAVNGIPEQINAGIQAQHALSNRSARSSMDGVNPMRVDYRMQQLQPVDTPRLAFAEDRTGIGIASAGQAARNALLQGGSMFKQFGGGGGGQDRSALANQKLDVKLNVF